MAEFELAAMPRLKGHIAVHEGCEARALQGGAMVSLAPRRGAKQAALREGLDRELGLELPAPGRMCSGADLQIAWSAHQQWLVFAAGDTSGALHQRLHDAIGAHADLTDQGDAWVGVSLGGPRATEVLARICALDLHPQAFTSAQVARTSMEHLQVLLARMDGEPAWRLWSASSSADSFWHMLTTALQSVCGPPL